jgi:hypothetical protein
MADAAGDDAPVRCHACADAIDPTEQDCARCPKCLEYVCEVCWADVWACYECFHALCPRCWATALGKDPNLPREVWAQMPHSAFVCTECQAQRTDGGESGGSAQTPEPVVSADSASA